MLMNGIRWVLVLIRDVADEALDLLRPDEETKETPAAKVPEPAAAPTAETTVATAPSTADRRKVAREAAKALPAIQQERTVKGVVDALSRVIGPPSRRVRHPVPATQWDCGRRKVTCSVQMSEGVVGITIYDGRAPMTWRITERRTLDYAVRGLLWHLAEMDVFPLETAAS